LPLITVWAGRGRDCLGRVVKILCSEYSDTKFKLGRRVEGSPNHLQEPAC
jgi:hypothetical protein